MTKPRKLSQPDKLKQDYLNDIQKCLNKLTFLLSKIEFNQNGAEGMSNVLDKVKEHIRVKGNE